MELTFVPKERSGWRGRGAPPLPVPDRIIDILTRTDGTGEVGVLDISGETEPDIHDLILTMRRGARQLGRRVRIQRTDGRLLFQMAEVTE